MPILPSEERILHGADELFCRFGIKNVTMDDIARHIGMSKKTIYLHFEDKNKIVMRLVELTINDHTEKFDAFVKTSKNAIEEILHIMDYMRATFARCNPNMYYDMQRFHPEAWQIFRKFKEEKAFEQVMMNFEKGRQQGLYRKDFNAKILSRLRLEEVEIGMNPTCFPPDKFNIHDVQVQLLDHFLHGICTLKGHKLLNKIKKLEEDEE